MVRGTVKSWNDDEGWGVLMSPDAPGEIWAHFSHIEAEGYRTLATGAAVSFDYERLPGGQEGYDFRATRDDARLPHHWRPSARSSRG